MLRRDRWLAPRAAVRVAPSILSADFARLGDECRAVLEAGGDLLHLDVMDGHFVPNLTMGPAVCRSLRAALPDVFLDVHMMVAEPARFVEPFQRAGADLLTFHIEAVPEPAALAATIRSAGLLVGLALNPDTPASAVLPFVEHVDQILVMSVFPGFSGQKFIADVLDKARAIKPRLGPGRHLQIDGGVSPTTAPACREAGCDVLVAASAVFGHPSYRDAIAHIRGDDAAPAAERPDAPQAARGTR